MASSYELIDRDDNYTSGFFNSNSSTTRKYTAEQMNKLFEGLISPGIYESVGQAFMVSANTNASTRQVKVGTGRAWLDNMWLYDDTTTRVLDLNSTTIPSGYKRYDAIVIHTKKSDKTCTIEVITGSPASGAASPSFPTLSSSTMHLIGYVTVTGSNSTLAASSVTNMVGIANKSVGGRTIYGTKFITAVLTDFNLDAVVNNVGNKLADLEQNYPNAQAMLDGLSVINGQFTSDLNMLAFRLAQHYVYNYKQVIWTNSDPSNFFGPRTLTLSRKIVAGDMIEIEYSNQKDDTSVSYAYVKYGDVAQLRHLWVAPYQDNNSLSSRFGICYRETTGTIGGATMTWERGNYFRAYLTGSESGSALYGNNTRDNYYCIPLKISKVHTHERSNQYRVVTGVANFASLPSSPSNSYIYYTRDNMRFYIWDNAATTTADKWIELPVLRNVET